MSVGAMDYQGLRRTATSVAAHALSVETGSSGVVAEFHIRLLLDYGFCFTNNASTMPKLGRHVAPPFLRVHPGFHR